MLSALMIPLCLCGMLRRLPRFLSVSKEGFMVEEDLPLQPHLLPSSPIILKHLPASQLPQASVQKALSPNHLLVNSRMVQPRPPLTSTQPILSQYHA